MTAAPPAMCGEIEAALEEHGVRPVRVSLLSPLRERKGVRLAWRVDAADGRTLKARDFGTDGDARRVFELHAQLPPAFAPALARHGSVLIEEWIDGAPLDDHEAGPRFEEAGALLGRLHGTALGPNILPNCPTRGWSERAASDTAILIAAGKVTRRDADALRGELARRDPGSGRAAIIHTDFCAENIVVDARGDLRVIDNENLAIGSAGFDLGCTYHRWPMSEADWTRFRRGYRSAAPCDPEAIGYWRIVAALMGARVFLEHDPTRLDAPLALLRLFAAGENLTEEAVR